MNMFTTYLSSISQEFFQVPPSSYPSVLWNYYIQCLWNYQPQSWVARIASICRVLAILVSLPIVILALLDISSYGIARTLGVIDDVKASTSDIATHRLTLNAPLIQVSSQSDSPLSESDHDSGSPTEQRQQPGDFTPASSTAQDPLSPSYLGASHPQAFYASEGENLKLSGVGVFSPATSRPPSPVLIRRSLQPESVWISGRQEQDDGLRQRVKLAIE